MSELDQIDAMDTDEAGDTFAWPPIPDEELTKGSTLTATRLSELGAIRHPHGSAAFAFALLRLRDELMRASVQKGDPISIRISKGGLHVNTDAEASEYHDGRGGQAIETIKRQVSMLHRVVDVAKLSSAEQQRHDRSLCLWGARMAGLKHSTKRLMAPDNQ